MMRPLICALALFAGIAGTASAAPVSAAPGGFRAGAARVDITPAAVDLPAPFKTIHDPLDVRAVVLEAGGTRAVLVVADVPTIAAGMAADLRRRIADAADTQPDKVLLAVTHSHNGVRIDPEPVGTFIPGSAKIAAATAEGMLAAVKLAASRLKPARAGYASGVANMVGRRPASSAAARGEGEQNRTLGVLKVEDLAGEPIAFLVNSSLEPVIGLAAPAEISSDLAGVAERAIERRYGDRPVALYTVGSSVEDGGALYSARDAAGPPPDPNMLMQAVGTLFAEDALAVAARITPSTDLRIAGAMRVVSCPGKVATRPGAAAAAARETAPVQLAVGVLDLGQMRFVEADANITEPVWQQVKAKAPAATVLVSLYFGPMHYVVPDAAYAGNGDHAGASTARPGCAAQGFVDAATALLASVRP